MYIYIPRKTFFNFLYCSFLFLSDFMLLLHSAPPPCCLLIAASCLLCHCLSSATVTNFEYPMSEFLIMYQSWCTSADFPAPWLFCVFLCLWLWTLCIWTLIIASWILDLPSLLCLSCCWSGLFTQPLIFRLQSDYLLFQIIKAVYLATGVPSLHSFNIFGYQQFPSLYSEMNTFLFLTIKTERIPFFQEGVWSKTNPVWLFLRMPALWVKVSKMEK